MSLFDFLFEEKKPGTFASLRLSSTCSKKLHKWMDKQNIDNLVDESDYHCTIVFSTKPVEGLENLEYPSHANIIGWKVLGSPKLLVAVLDDSKLKPLFDKTMEMGAVSDYPSFIPHISVAINYKGELPAKLPNIKIQFKEFRVEGLDKNFDYKDQADS